MHLTKPLTDPLDLKKLTNQELIEWIDFLISKGRG